MHSWNHIRERVALVGALLVAACSGDDSDEGSGTDGSPEQTGKVCELAADCYPNVAEGELSGEALCLDRVRDGYCTHECSADADCCAAEGECDTDLAQVCSPFESTNSMMCFLSCEPDAVGSGEYEDEQEFCQREASRDFICRSSGGGSNNRKICVPGDCGVGAACATHEDCPQGLSCYGNFDGGYCGRKDCNENSDCPEDTQCVTLTDGNYCLRSCSNQSDCSFCRGSDHPAECSDSVEFSDTGSGSVCVPR